MANDKKIYDLEDRTSKFGMNTIIFVKKIPHNLVDNIFISQLVRSATSIGANYCEADCAESRKDFEHKIAICKKESKETKHWLKMISTSNPNLKEEIKPFLKEVIELNLIFSAIINSSRSNNRLN